MKKFQILLLILSTVVQLSCAQKSGQPFASGEDMMYFGLRPPGLEPEVFAPNLISKPERHEFGSIFSGDGKEFFFGIDTDGKAEIWFSKLTHGVWSQPEVILSHGSYSFNDPMLSPEEDRLYFISDMPIDGRGDKKDYDIWYVEREEKSWSKPYNVGAPINTAANEYYISFTSDGSMYFASNFDPETKGNREYNIFRSSLVSGEYQDPVKLTDKINTKRYEADAFVADDESYIIFSSIREDGLGRGDLYISFKNEQGHWTEAKNMGDKINNEHHQLCPFVSKDGKYLFYTSNQDIYWVDARIIEKYK